MLRLPSTTEISRRFPKEKFYSHLKLDRKTHEQFLSGIERIMLTNSVKPSTANVADGSSIHEIMVFEVGLKTSELPLLALESIAATSRNAIIFVCCYRSETKTVVFRQGFHERDGAIDLKLDGGNLDAIWDAYVSQIVFGEPTSGNLDERIKRSMQIEMLEAEVARLRDKCMREKQFNKKNGLFAQMKDKQAELEVLRKGK